MSDSEPQEEPQGFLVPPIFIEMSRELAMDLGVIPMELREHKPVPRRTQVRWWLREKRERVAEVAYRLIAGHDVPERE